MGFRVRVRRVRERPRREAGIGEEGEEEGDSGGLESMREASSSFCVCTISMGLVYIQECRGRTFPATLNTAPFPALKRGLSVIES